MKPKDIAEEIANKILAEDAKYIDEICKQNPFMGNRIKNIVKTAAMRGVLEFMLREDSNS